MIKEMYEQYIALEKEINVFWGVFHEIHPKDVEKLRTQHQAINALNAKKDLLENTLYLALVGKCLRLDEKTVLICHSDDGYVSFEEVEFIEE